MNISYVQRKYRREIKAFGKFARVVRREWWMRGKGKWGLVLKVGVQSFVIGRDYDSKDGARWHRAMLCVALANLKKETT